ncbi:hypothetical protein GEV33_010716 [Tenebrio molitor]|uniref:Tyr recombinase domain-containing protein n=1 Tax=Tenebrio molitor TaxID=7067 RepID=A0A8J6L8P9_TENMO|nr:hypothetical protein GEV33_010716 [Tenebrio molitor]
MQLRRPESTQSDFQKDTILGHKANLLREKLLPVKSKAAYEKVYASFCYWRENNKVSAVTEEVILAYLDEKQETLSPALLWPHYSMLKSSLKVKENLCIEKFCSVTAYLKQINVGHHAKKSKVLSREHIEKFLLEAADETYLFVKPVEINTFGQPPSKIAAYLKLEDPKTYTGHCFRRSSATLLAAGGGDLVSLKRHGGWRSSTVAEGYIEDCVEERIKIARKFPTGGPLTRGGSRDVKKWSANSSSKITIKMGNNVNFKCKRLPKELANTMKLAITLVNAVKNSALKTRVFKKLCSDLDSEPETDGGLLGLLTKDAPALATFNQTINIRASVYYAGGLGGGRFPGWCMARDPSLRYTAPLICDGPRKSRVVGSLQKFVFAQIATQAVAATAAAVVPKYTFALLPFS